MNWATVPKATVNKNGDAGLHKQQVGRPSPIRNPGAVEAETKAQLMERAAQLEFTTRVAGELMPHSTTGCLVSFKPTHGGMRNFVIGNSPPVKRR